MDVAVLPCVWEAQRRELHCLLYFVPLPLHQPKAGYFCAVGAQDRELEFGCDRVGWYQWGACKCCRHKEFVWYSLLTDDFVTVWSADEVQGHFGPQVPCTFLVSQHWPAAIGTHNSEWVMQQMERCHLLAQLCLEQGLLGSYRAVMTHGSLTWSLSKSAEIIMEMSVFEQCHHGEWDLCLRKGISSAKTCPG